MKLRVNMANKRESNANIFYFKYKWISVFVEELLGIVKCKFNTQKIKFKSINLNSN